MELNEIQHITIAKKKALIWYNKTKKIITETPAVRYINILGD